MRVLNRTDLHERVVEDGPALHAHDKCSLVGTRYDTKPCTSRPSKSKTNICELCPIGHTSKCTLAAGFEMHPFNQSSGRTSACAARFANSDLYTFHVAEFAPAMPARSHVNIRHRRHHALPHSNTLQTHTQHPMRRAPGRHCAPQITTTNPNRNTSTQIETSTRVQTESRCGSIAAPGALHAGAPVKMPMRLPCR